jgi:hypothetical protein
MVIGHSIAAVFNYDSFIKKAFDIWQSLCKGMRFLRCGGYVKHQGLFN